MTKVAIKWTNNRYWNDETYEVSFPYSLDIIELIKKLKQRRWNSETKVWEISSSEVNALTNLLKENKHSVVLYKKPEIKEEFKSSQKQIKTIPSGSYLKSTKIKTKLYKHQEETLKYAESHPRFILGDDQGLGKTLQIISIASARRELLRDKHCLIIVGVNGLKYNWVDEVKTHLGEDAYILGQRISKSGKYRIGSSKDKYADLKKLPKNHFLILNAEALRYKEGKGRGKYVLSQQIADLCESGKINMVVFDEIHKCKNVSSRQTRGLLKIKADCQIAATGTMIMNKPLDAFVPLVWLGLLSPNYKEFINLYTIKGGFANKEIIGYKNLNVLNDIINNNMIRRLKSEVTDLPPKIYEDVYVELSKEERLLYKQILNATITNLESMKKKYADSNNKLSFNNTLSQWMRLRQVTSFPKLVDSTLGNCSKLEQLTEIVERCVENGEKVVVFSEWTSVADEVYSRLVDMGFKPAMITGKVTEDEREREKYRFQNDTECKVIIGTSKAMGTGLTLTAGTNVIFMESPWTKALKDQSEDRCHRIGTVGTVNIISLICRNTIDEYIEAIVSCKGRLSDMVINTENRDDGIYVLIEWLKDNIE